MAVNLIAYRGRNDDGNETTATWKAAQNTAWVQPLDVNFRVRFLHQNDTSAINNLDIQLQYSLNGGTYTNVTGSSSVVRSFASPNLADAANLTTQLTGGTGTYIGATGFDEVNGICGGASMDVTSTGHFETEFCVQLRSADVSPNDSVSLRTINSDTGTAWGTYTVVASLTAPAANAANYFTRTKPPLGVRHNIAHPLSRGLVGHWIMNERSGATLYDSAGSNNLTFSAGAAAPTWSAPAVSFDGGDSITAATDFLNGPTQLTVSAWAFATTLGNSVARALVSQEDFAGGYTNTTFALYYQGFVSPEKWSFLVSNNGTAVFDAFATNNLPVTNQWVFLVGTYDGETAAIYVNGKLDATNTSPTGALFNSSLTPMIGAERVSGSAADFWIGKIDDVRIYNRALTLNEITELYVNPYADIYRARPKFGRNPMTAVSKPKAMHHYKQMAAA